jgi:hypothetical protein
MAFFANSLLLLARCLHGERTLRSTLDYIVHFESLMLITDLYVES